MKAIETVYNGYKFRSRLEARWAVFFDAMGIKYLYEPEGFEMFEDVPETETLRYLPDFYLPDYDVYAEVKGAYKLGDISKEDMERMTWFVDYDGPLANGLVLLGSIPNCNTDDGIFYATLRWNGKGLDYGYTNGFESPYPDMNSFDPFWSGSAPYSIPECSDFSLTSSVGWSGSDKYFGLTHDTQTSRALTAARQARFEYGE